MSAPAPATGRRRLKVVCPHDCPDTCVMTVDVEGGRAVAIGGDPDHRFTQGFLCAKVNRYLERVYSPDRVLHPMRRVGRKGEGRFERISWDDALDAVASRLRGITERHGPQAILPYSYAGNMGLLGYGSMDRRFFHALGASLLDRTICSTAGAQGYKATAGKTMGYDPEAVVHARLVVAWGANIVSSNVHFWPFVEEARRRGARLVCVDPYRSRTAEVADLHLAPYPGTDAALALGMMHVVFRDGLEDRDWLERHAVGHEELRERAREWTPARAAATTGLTAEEIEAFAREYATTRPSAIRLNYGMNRHAGGGMAVRTVACLPAVVGAWRDPGGGALLSTSGTFPVDDEALQRPDLVPPGTRTINMVQLGRVLTDPTLDPPVKALFVYNSNPAAVAPEQEAVRRGLAREDLFVVVHEQMQTDTADFADILLPATTALEHYDLHKAYGHLYVSLSRPAIAPLGEALPNTELVRRLAARMGLDHPCLRDSDEEMARQAFKWDHPAMKGITLERLEREGALRLSVPDPFVPFAEGGFPTPSGKCELRSEKLAREGHDPVAGYVPPREGPTSAPEVAKRYPLAFISPPAHHFLNSTFSSQPVFLRREGEASVTIHPGDAEPRGIAEGATVRVFNDRGSFLARARVSDAARPGVVVGLSIWWPKLCPGGRNANAVTSQEVTDMGGGATFFDALVDVVNSRPDPGDPGGGS
ncbi:MAG TPA: molybdopterin oxidoreductase family protein [Vicinamibacteria bacterium]|nr:molybdopterin oxidoreductase family protein [Vicinamibacteria bacterium]